MEKWLKIYIQQINSIMTIILSFRVNMSLPPVIWASFGLHL